MSSKFYKCCAVPQCTSTTIKIPDKLFIHVPRSENRKMWLKLAGRDPALVPTQSKMYFCEDHFDLPNDMENYTEYHLMGSVSQVRMRAGCLPTKFECQLDRKRQTDNITTQPLAVKRQRIAESEIVIENAYSTQSISMAEVQPGPRSDQIKRINSNIETHHPEAIITLADNDYVASTEHCNANDDRCEEETDTFDKTNLFLPEIDIKCEPLGSYSEENYNYIDNTEIQNHCENINEKESNWSNNIMETDTHKKEMVKRFSSVIEARVELLRAQTLAAQAELKLNEATIEQQELEHRTRMHYLQREGELKIQLLEEQLQIKNKTNTTRGRRK